jgi:hypothetical protein|tara:strand:+ start:1768 stop:2091 length:324 start_codon:yes stop_codon:yes gene_type:complete
MKFVNRGYLLVRPTKQFVKWANSTEPEFEMNEDFLEGNIYLIEEDFLEPEPIIESNFKKILKNELESVTDNEELWPEKLNVEIFEQFFTVEVGNMVFDLQKTDLLRE